MARTGRAFPGKVTQVGRAQLEWANLPAVPPTPRQQVFDAAITMGTLRARHGAVTVSRWPGYQWTGLAPVTPLIEPRITSPADTAVAAMRLPRRTRVVVLRSVALEVPTSPPVSWLKRAPQPRQARAPRLVSSRWPGYQWVGLPAVTPLIQAVVYAAKAPRRRVGRIVMPWPLGLAVTQAAPVVTPVANLLVRASKIRRVPVRVATMPVQLAAQTVAAATVFPLTRPFVSRLPAVQRRVGRVLRRFVAAPVEAQAPITPARLMQVDAPQRKSRLGRVVAARLPVPPVATPTGPAPRPFVARPGRARFTRPGRIILTAIQRFVPTGGIVIPWPPLASRFSAKGQANLDDAITGISHTGGTRTGPDDAVGPSGRTDA